MSTIVQWIGTACFGCAILHTFSASTFQRLAHRYKSDSAVANLLHLLGEVEVVFGIWAGLFVAAFAIFEGVEASTKYLDSLSFTEPLFVFVVMTVTATQPVLDLAGYVIGLMARLVPLPYGVSFTAVTLIFGPLLGSFITEPAAMTVTASLLLEHLFAKKISTPLRYLALGVLFVNVSVGGTLTPFAAPPILMVANRWNWDLDFVLSNFGWKGALSCVLSTALLCAVFFREFKGISGARKKLALRSPLWVVSSHVLLLAGIVAFHQLAVVFMGLFLFFLGLVNVSRKYHENLKIRESLLVAFFLGGLVVLGGPQNWWLQPILMRLDSGLLFLSAGGLTAIVDNAALTFLGSQVPDLSEISKYALTAGAVVGGGLTVIANAPNPAGFSILNPSFKGGINSAGLLLGALPPTLIAGACYWLL